MIIKLLEEGDPTKMNLDVIILEDDKWYLKLLSTQASEVGLNPKSFLDARKALRHLQRRRTLPLAYVIDMKPSYILADRIPNHPDAPLFEIPEKLHKLAKSRG